MMIGGSRITERGFGGGIEFENVKIFIYWKYCDE